MQFSDLVYYTQELSTSAKEAAANEFNFDSIDGNSQLWLALQDCTTEAFVKSSFGDGSSKNMVIVTVDDWDFPKKGLQDDSGK